MTPFFDLYRLMTEDAKLPGPDDTLADWLGSFVGKTGRQVFDFCVDAHHSIHQEKGDADYDEYHKSALDLLHAASTFVMKDHLKGCRDICHKTANPSWWEKEHGGHDHYKELKKKGANPEDLRHHPWHQSRREGHANHWKAIATSLNEKITEKNIELDGSDEAQKLRDAWTKYHKHIEKHPTSQWKDRRKRPELTDFSHDGSN